MIAKCLRGMSPLRTLVGVAEPQNPLRKADRITAASHIMVTLPISDALQAGECGRRAGGVQICYALDAVTPLRQVDCRSSAEGLIRPSDWYTHFNLFPYFPAILLRCRQQDAAREQETENCSRFPSSSLRSSRGSLRLRMHITRRHCKSLQCDGRVRFRQRGRRKGPRDDHPFGVTRCRLVGLPGKAVRLVPDCRAESIALDSPSKPRAWTVDPRSEWRCRRAYWTVRSDALTIWTARRFAACRTWRALLLALQLPAEERANPPRELLANAPRLADVADAQGQ